VMRVHTRWSLRSVNTSSSRDPETKTAPCKSAGA